MKLSLVQPLLDAINGTHRLIAGATGTFNSKNTALSVYGLAVTGETRGNNSLNLTEVPYDGVHFELIFGNEGKSETFLKIEGDDTEQHIEVKTETPDEGWNDPINNGYDTANISLKVHGSFTVIYRTQCGDPSRDGKVRITVKPNHSEQTAEISYSFSQEN